MPGIWALGDCNGKGAFTHTAYNDFEIVASNLLDGARRGVSDRIPAYALYIDPPLGRAGMTETEARQHGHAVLVATRPMTRVARAIEKGETNGMMKIVVDAQSQEILGAAVFGTGGDEVIHCVLDTMYAKAPTPSSSARCTSIRRFRSSFRRCSESSGKKAIACRKDRRGLRILLCVLCELRVESVLSELCCLGGTDNRELSELVDLIERGRSPEAR